MQQWLFVSSSGQQFTANEPDVPALVQSGQIGAQTLMWREGMAQWMPAASVFPLLFSASTAATQPMVAGGGLPTAAAADPPTAPAGVAVAARAGYGGGGAVTDTIVRRLAAPLFERKGWIKLVGILSIIGGIFALPMFLLGLLPLFAGIALMKMAGSLERAQSHGDLAALEEAQRASAKYFYFSGLLFAIQLVISVLVIAVVLAGSGAAMLGGLKGLKERGGFDQGNDGGPTIDDIRFPDSPPLPDGQ